MKKGHSLLWSVQDDAGNSSYLFGTMHVRSQVAHQFADQVMPFLSEVDVYAAEMDLGAFDQELFLDTCALPGEVSLETLLGKKKLPKIRRILWKSFGIDLNPYLKKHPFLLTAALGESMLPEDHGHSLDQELWNRAKALERICTGLESFEDQLYVLRKIPPELSAKSLATIAKNPKRYRRSLLKTVAYYEQQDIRQLYRYGRRHLQGLRKILLLDRNRKMTREFLSLQGEHRIFAAVGAGHLGGKYGMLKLLKLQGKKIAPIELKLP